MTEEFEGGIRIFVGDGGIWMIVEVEDEENAGVATLSIIACSLNGHIPAADKEMS